MVSLLRDEKYNRETGSNLKAPQPGGGPRKRSFCARMSGNKGPMKDSKGRPYSEGSSPTTLEVLIMPAKRGLYANIHAKRKRIAAGSGEKMRKPGSKGAPTAANFKRSAKTAKKK